jgi:hypothetical protein
MIDEMLQMERPPLLHTTADTLVKQKCKDAVRSHVPIQLEIRRPGRRKSPARFRKMIRSQRCRSWVALGEQVYLKADPLDLATIH